MPDQQEVPETAIIRGCTVYATPVARREKLKSLGIPEQLLIDAVQYGVAEKLTQVVYDPATSGGIDLYRYTTREVRRGLHELGWELSDSNNIALVRNPINDTTVIVCSGDQQTGQLIGDLPKTKRSKGEVFLEVTEVQSVDLFGNEEVTTRLVAVPDKEVWLLLHYHLDCKDGQTLRAELSRPLEAEDGIITKWSERIILHIPLPDAMPDDDSGTDTGPVVIPNVKIRI